MRDYLLKLLTPLIKYLGSLHMPWTHKKVTGKHYYIWRDLIEIGTVFLTTAYGELSNLYNPSKYGLKHGAIYLGYIDGIPSVLEATGKGVVLTDLVSFLTSKDRVVGCKPLFINDEDRKTIVSEGLKRVGLSYDYLFKDKNSAQYCYELPVNIFLSVKANVILNSYIVGGSRIYNGRTYLEDDRFLKLFDSKDLEL